MRATFAQLWLAVAASALHRAAAAADAQPAPLLAPPLLLHLPTVEAADAFLADARHTVKVVAVLAAAAAGPRDDAARVRAAVRARANAKVLWFC